MLNNPYSFSSMKNGQAPGKAKQITKKRLKKFKKKMRALRVAKLDGTSKGGISIPIVKEMGIPISFIGTGESLEDIAQFDAKSFTEGLLP